MELEAFQSLLQSEGDGDDDGEEEEEEEREEEEENLYDLLSILFTLDTMKIF